MAGRSAHFLVVCVCELAIKTFVAAEGYSLGGIYADLPGQECAFYAMFDQLRRDAAAAVAVPDLGHLAHLPALAAADPRTASRYLHARLLLIAPRRPADRPGRPQLEVPP